MTIFNSAMEQLEKAAIGYVAALRVEEYLKK
jgi:hypothetical protein